LTVIVGVQAEQRQPRRGQHHAKDRRRFDALAKEDGCANRHQHHTQPGDEAGFGRRRVEQPLGLEIVAGGERQPDPDRRQDALLPGAGGCAGFWVIDPTPAPVEQDRRKGCGRRPEAQRQQRKGGEVAHCVLDQDEGRTPDDHDGEQRGVGDELAARHNNEWRMANDE
jgi:hypothetical protein